MSCDYISIGQLLLLFFYSLSMRLLVFHLEYHCILLWLIRLTNCLKMGCSLRPKRRKNTWFIWKLDCRRVIYQYANRINTFQWQICGPNSKTFSKIFFAWFVMKWKIRYSIHFLTHLWPHISVSLKAFLSSYQQHKVYIIK